MEISDNKQYKKNDRGEQQQNKVKLFSVEKNG